MNLINFFCHYRNFNNIVNIEKLGKPVKRFYANSFKSTQNFKGKENPIRVKGYYKGTFTCTFTNIKNYPFGSESCNVIIIIVGSDEHLTNLSLINLQYDGEKTVNEFQIINVTAVKSSPGISFFNERFFQQSLRQPLQYYIWTWC